jgi:Acyl-CoA synthetases (AMP-forming)/AMP-acid ligases II
MDAALSFANLPSSLHALLDERADRFGSRTYVITEGGEATYSDLARRSRQFAGKLMELGAQPNSRILVLMPASETYLGLWFAISRIGATEAPINPAYKGLLLRQLVETADPSLCIVDDSFREQFDQACEGLIPAERVKRPQDLDGPSAAEAISPSVSPRDISSIIFTSGTTGQSKGVMISHRHQLSFGQAYVEITGLREDDTTYNFLPFFHIAAKFVALGTMLAGGRMLLRPTFSVSNFWKDVCTHGVTVCSAVGGLCHMLNSQPRQPDDADNPLRLIYAVPVPWEFKDAFEQRFGLTLVEGYGGTENNLVAYSRIGEDTPRGAIGRPSPHFDVRVLREDGFPAEHGEAGEICIRPHYPGTMMSGYIGMPEKTLETMGDFWFHTGDRGVMDKNGYLFFLDRIKDAIRRRGENISSFEVERVLNACPHVAESAVIPVPSELAEDEVKAVVVLKEPGSMSEEDLFRYAMDSMPYFMVPRYIEFRDSLPRTPTMKIKKTDLRAEGITNATWDCERAGLKITRHGLATRATSA